MTCMSLCLIDQAVGYDTPKRRFNSKAETWFFDCVKRCIVRNPTVSGHGVASKIAPEITAVWCRQWRHIASTAILPAHSGCNGSPDPSDNDTLPASAGPPALAHIVPSVPYSFRNAAINSPR